MPRLLQGTERVRASLMLDEAARTGLHSPCLRRQAGAVLALGTKILGRAFNSPPVGLKNFVPHCSPYPPHLKDGFGSDKTCCVHAEERVIMDVLAQYGKGVMQGAIMYYASINEHGNWRRPSGKPRCTICSKMAAETKLKGWVLEHQEGITFYDAQEYNDLSFEYGRK